MNDNTGEWFRTIIRVWQGCHLSPTVFNIFLERTVFDALEEHNGKLAAVVLPLCDLRMALTLLLKKSRH